MAAAAALAGVSACATTVAGSPFVAPTGPVNIAALDTGGYPIRPAAPLGTAGSSPRGRVLEGHRLAEYVVRPDEVDPTLLRAVPQNTATLDSSHDLPEPLGDIARTHGFIVGFSTARRSVGPERKLLIAAVLRCPDAPSAAAVAMAATSSHPGDGDVAIPHHPEARASTVRHGGDIDVSSFTAHGPYVLYQFAESDASVKVAADLVAATLDLQQPRIDVFVPTDVSLLAGLPVDATGLLARTLPVVTNYLPSNGMAVYSWRAALHFEDDPASIAALFAANKVQLVSVGKARVYQTADVAGAARVADALAVAASDNGYHQTTGAAGLPMAKCFDGGRGPDRSPRRFYCVAVARQYAFDVFSDREQDAHQQVAAQYRMLSSSS